MYNIYEYKFEMLLSADDVLTMDFKGPVEKLYGNVVGHRLYASYERKEDALKRLTAMVAYDDGFGYTIVDDYWPTIANKTNPEVGTLLYVLLDESGNVLAFIGTNAEIARRGRPGVDDIFEYCG